MWCAPETRNPEWQDNHSCFPMHLVMRLTVIYQPSPNITVRASAVLLPENISQRNVSSRTATSTGRRHFKETDLRYNSITDIRIVKPP